VGRLDEHLLRDAPEKRGGKLVFQNPGVKIYAF
jgi:hypothetical protein